MIGGISNQIVRVTCMSATIHNFSDTTAPTYKFPDFLFIDTSFLINALVPVPEKTPLLDIASKCDDFLKEIRNRATNEELALFTDESVLDEFFYFILQAKVKNVDCLKPPYDKHVIEYNRRSRNPVSELFKDHPELIAKYYSLLENYYDKITAIPVAILEPEHLTTKARESIGERMCELIKNYNILPADALHVSVAKQAGINDFVVIDGDYHRIDGIGIYTCITSREFCKVCKSKIG